MAGRINSIRRRRATRLGQICWSRGPTCWDRRGLYRPKIADFTLDLMVQFVGLLDPRVRFLRSTNLR